MPGHLLTLTAFPGVWKLPNAQPVLVSDRAVVSSPLLQGQTHAQSPPLGFWRQLEQPCAWPGCILIVLYSSGADMAWPRWEW